MQKLKGAETPEVVLMDINMPIMNGYEAALWLRTHYPSVKVIALSMYDDESSIIRMLNNGAKGYLLKDSEPGELHHAIQAVITKGFYYSNTVAGRIMHAIQDEELAMPQPVGLDELNENELQFLKWTCTELTYKEIAEQMCYSPRTIDGFRDGLFYKLKVKSRVGLVLYAIRHGVITI
jgi:DNA-binding NarL/FixJ family response regulator